MHRSSSLRLIAQANKQTEGHPRALGPGATPFLKRAKQGPMRAGAHIAEVESEARPAPASFAEALHALARLLAAQTCQEIG